MRRPNTYHPTRRSATVQRSLNFLTAVRRDRVVARSRITRAGGTLVFAEASRFDEAGALCATATGLSRLSSIPWAADGTPATN